MGGGVRTPCIPLSGSAHVATVLFSETHRHHKTRQNISMSCGDDKKPLHIVTPIVRSTPISKKAGFDVYLKLENLQVPGSFKIRGIGNLITNVSHIGGNVERQPNYVRKKQYHRLRVLFYLKITVNTTEVK